MTDPDAGGAAIARYSRGRSSTRRLCARRRGREGHRALPAGERASARRCWPLPAPAHGIELVTFSSDLVFDGRQQTPYVESDAVGAAQRLWPQQGARPSARCWRPSGALVVRTSAFFSPWDRHNFVTQALAPSAGASPSRAADDMTVSPTYVPDLVHACLDLLIDGESGLWHLTNSGRSPGPTWRSAPARWQA